MIRGLPCQAKRALRALAFICLAGLSVTACATTPQASSHMPAGHAALPPAGLLDLCHRAPEFCGRAGEADAPATSAIVIASAADALPEATGANPAAMPGRASGGKMLAAAPDPDLLNARSDGATTETVEPEGDEEPSLVLKKLVRDENAETEAEAQAAADAEEAASFARAEDGRLLAAPELFALLNRVNQRINMQIRPRDDIETYGVAEYWALPLTVEGTAEGDCEDYALEKRQALLEAGVPDSALFLAVGHSAATGRHAVLVVSTDQGDYVLDNMTPHILPWGETPYQWQLRQVPGDLLSWRHIALVG